MGIATSSEGNDDNSSSRPQPQACLQTQSTNMSFDSHEISEGFTSAEAEFKIAQASWNQELDQIRELAGEPRKAAIFKAETASREMKEAVDGMEYAMGSVPARISSSVRTKVRSRVRDYSKAAKEAEIELQRQKLYGDRYRDNPTGDAGHDQRQQLLKGTDRLGGATESLNRAQVMALDTEHEAAEIMANLHRQREVIQHTGNTLLESEGYVDRSVKTLRGMSRRMATNRIITIAIITVLVLLIMAVIYSKFK